MEAFDGKTDLATKHLYLIYDLGILTRPLSETEFRSLFQAGVDLVQLRAKDFARMNFIGQLEMLVPVAVEYGVPVIVNDEVEIAEALPSMMKAIDGSCDTEKLWGVHLGQDDMSCQQARAKLGEDAIIGITVHTLDEAIKASQESADYIGYGSMFTTQTKDDAKAGKVEIAKKINTTLDLPLYLLGGIDVGNIDNLICEGFSYFAIAGGILRQDNPSEVAGHIKRKILNACCEKT